MDRVNYEDLDPYLNVEEYNRNKNQVALAKLVPKDKRYKRKIKIKKSFYAFFFSYKKLSHSVIFVGSLVSLVIFLLLIIIPVSGIITISYPFSQNKPIQNTGQKLIEPINNIYYKSEYLWKGNTIDFSTSSNSSVSIAIVNSSLNQISQSTNQTTGSFSTSVKLNKYSQKNTTFFLFKGDTIHLQVSVQYPTTSTISGSNSLELIISNQPSYYHPIFIKNGLNNISFIAPTTDYWQFGYFNDFSGSQSFLQFEVSYNYTISSINFSKNKPIFISQTKFSNNSFQVDKNGLYTIVIFTRNQDSNISTLVNYNIVFHSGIDSIDAWKGIDPILNVIVFIIFLILLLTIILRIVYIYDNDSSKNELQHIKRQTNNYDKGTALRSYQNNVCPKCGTKNELSDKFCAICGTELKVGE